MTVEENKAVVRREMAELFNHTGNLDAVEEIISPDYVSYEPTSGETRGIEGARQFAATFRQAFPDLQNTIEDMVAEGDKVAVRWTTYATHRGRVHGRRRNREPYSGNELRHLPLLKDRPSDASAIGKTAGGVLVALGARLALSDAR